MSAQPTEDSVLPFSIAAGIVVQLLSALACFLAAIVLPEQFPEFKGAGQYVLAGLGILFLLAAVLSVLLRRWISAFAQRTGLTSRVLVPREGLVYLGIMLIIAIAALTGGNPDTGNMLLLVFGMMAGPFVVNGWFVVGMLTRITVTRSVPAAAQAGTFFTVDIAVRNERGVLSSRLLEVRDIIQGHRIQQQAGVTFVCVPPGQTRVAEYQLCIQRRGLYRFGPMSVSSHFPLGIGERGHAVPQRDEIIIHPTTGFLLPAWRKRERNLTESIRTQNTRMGMFEDEFHGIREFRSGDNSRAVHWRSTARHGQLMVKEHHQHRQGDFTLLLDLYAADPSAELSLEKAISLTATLCLEQTRQTGCRLVIAGQKTDLIETVGSSGFREAALRALAICEASSEASLKDLFESVCRVPIASSQRFIVVTPRPDECRRAAAAVARQYLRNEGLLTGRLLIIASDEQHLAEVFSLTSENRTPATVGGPYA